MKQKHDNNKTISSGTKAIIDVVRSIAPLSEPDIDLLLSILESKTIKNQEYLLREGEVCRNVYFLLTGFFRMFYVDYDGNEINYRFTDKHNFLVDFQSLLTQKPSHFYWQAMQDSELFVLPYQDIQKAYTTSPAWNNFGRLMAERVYLQLNERVEMLLFMRPEERYQYLLDTKPELFVKISQFHLSSYMGIKPESLSRLRKRLSKK